MENIKLAIIENNLPLVKELLQYNNINEVDSDGNNYLHLAIIYKKVEIAYYLLENNIYINALNKYNMTPLYLAVHYNNMPIVQALLKTGAQVMLSNFDLETPFYHACSLARSNMINLFLEYQNYDFDYVNAKGENLIFALIRSGNLNLLKRFYNDDLKNTVNNMGDTYLHVAIQTNKEDVILYLLTLGLNVNVLNKLKESPLYIAIKENNYNVIKLLLKNGALTSFKDPNGFTYEELISKLNNDLLMYDQTKTYQNKYPLHYSIIVNDYSLFLNKINAYNLIIKDNHNNSALDLAYALKNKTFIKEILQFKKKC